MSNVYVIAKKEFADLLRSNIVLIVLAVYVVLLLYSYYYSYTRMGGIPDILVDVLCGYGSLVAVMLGLSAMYNDTGNKAINTLIVKPVYRDTILNGKLLGALCFALFLFVFTILINMSLNFMFWGEQFSRVFVIFLEQLPLILISFLFSFIIFYSLTTLMFILVRDNCLSFFMGVVAWIFIYYVIPSGFSSSLGAIVGSGNSDVAGMISGLSPERMIFLIFSNTTGTLGALSINSFEFAKLSLYVVILLALNYIAFLRSDLG